MTDPVTDPVPVYALERPPLLIDALTTLVACPSVGADPAMAPGMEVARCLIEIRLHAMAFRNPQRPTPLPASPPPA
jgi:hypothetical protein